MKQSKIFVFLFAALCSVFAQSVSAQDATARNKANALAAYDALNRHDWAAFAALCDAKKYQDIGVAPVPLVGVDAALESYKQFFSAFSDFKIAVNEIATISSTRFLLRVTLSGNNTGALMGIPATGKAMRYDDCDLVEFDAAGKIVLHQPTKGGQEVFRQLGIDVGPTAMNKQIAMKIMNDLAVKNLGSITAACTSDCRFNGWAPQPLDVNGYKQAMMDLFAAFPDAKFGVDDVVAEGDKVVVRHHVKGTHTGTAFQGVPASQRKIDATATVTFQFKEGKATELWLNADLFTIMMQLGAIPAPGK